MRGAERKNKEREVEESGREWKRVEGWGGKEREKDTGKDGKIEKREI